jgi:hypothetical protein
MKEDDGFWQNLKQGDIGGLLGNTWQAARDEYLGIDDARRAISKMREGNFLGALKSLATGGLELGTSMLPLVGQARAAALPVGIRQAAKFLGAGAKVPARGFALNIGGNLAAPVVLPPVMSRLPVIGPRMRAAEEAAQAMENARQERLGQLVPAGYQSVFDTIAGTSPSAANQEALFRLLGGL